MQITASAAISTISARMSCVIRSGMIIGLSPTRRSRFPLNNPPTHHRVNSGRTVTWDQPKKHPVRGEVHERERSAKDARVTVQSEGSPSDISTKYQLYGVLAGLAPPSSARDQAARRKPDHPGSSRARAVRATSFPWGALVRRVRRRDGFDDWCDREFCIGAAPALNPQRSPAWRGGFSGGAPPGACPRLHRCRPGADSALDDDQ